MPISFPSSPSNGQQYTAGTKTWEWNGSAWVQVAATANIGDSAVTTSKLATGSVTADKIADGTIVAAEIASGAVTADKIGAGAVTSAKLAAEAVDAAALGTAAVTNAKLASNAVTQAKMASNLSGITVTTTANRSTDVPSPFTGQFIFLTDTSALQRWDGSTWVAAITTVPTAAPTGLSASNATGTTVDISFSAGADGGSAITNYEYALSTNGGSTYGSYAALSPADGTSPITITGLTSNTAYYVKLKAVNALGTGSSESTPVSFSTVGVPAAPTGLAGTALSTSSVSISFSQVAATNAITNYKYALSTNGGSTYGSYTALSPADSTSPITISGLSAGTTYSIKLRAVNSDGDGTESAATSVATVPTLTVDYLVVAGGGGGGGDNGGGGGAGGLRCTVTATGGGGTLETALSPTLSTNYSVSIGAGGVGGGINVAGSSGSNSTFSTITSTGGGGGAGGNAVANTPPKTGGSGGGGEGENPDNYAGAAGTANQGYAGGSGYLGAGGGGGGAGAVGGNATGASVPGNGGAGVTTSIIGSSTTYAGGGGGGTENDTARTSGGQGGSGGGGAGSNGVTSPPNPVAGTVNTGGGGGALSNGGLVTGNETAASGGSGVVILRYHAAYTIALGAGLTGSTSTVGSNKVTTITAGTGNVSWT